MNRDGGITILPETSIVRKGEPFFIPDRSLKWHFTLMPAIRIDKLGKCIEQRFATRYYNDIIFALKAGYENNGAIYYPEGFDGSVMLSLPINGMEIYKIKTSPLPRVGNDRIVETVFDLTFTPDANLIDQSISEASKFYTLHTGDILLLNNVIGELDAKENMRIEIISNERVLLSHKIK